MKLLCDLHLHSCLSPCGADDMTPNNIVNMAALAGYNAIALSDHNSTCNCAAAMEVGKQVGVLVVPAMELTTAEEVHTLMYMPDLDAAEELRRIVYAALPPRKNKPKAFGYQYVMDENDEVVREEEALLAAATSIGIYKAQAIARDLGGLAVPAHIDRASFSLLANMGMVDPAMDFRVFEVTRGCGLPELIKANRLEGCGFTRGSDAHDLSAMPDPFYELEVESMSPRGIIKAISALTTN